MGVGGGLYSLLPVSGTAIEKQYFFIFSTPKIGSDDVKTVDLISFIKCLLSTYYYVCTTLRRQKGRSARTERRRGSETVTILNFNLLLPIAMTKLAEIRGFMTVLGGGGGGGIDFDGLLIFY